MIGRHWFYVPVLMVVGGLLTWGATQSALIRAEQQSANVAGVSEQKAILERYLAAQTDEHKLISLAKRMKTADPALVKLVADRAYQIAPKNRDVVVLASLFHPELKTKILEIDPLYAETKN